MAKQKVLILLTFIAGFMVSILATWGSHIYGLHSYRQSDGKILRFNPYQYESKSKLSTQYFYTSLPRIVQIAIQNKKMNFDYLTACEGDIIPGGFSEIPVSFFQGDVPSLFVFELESDFRVKIMHDASSLLNLKKNSASDHFEIQCLAAAPLLNDSRFQAIENESALTDQLKLTNRDIIQIKTKGSKSSEIIAYSIEDKKFHHIGNVNEDGK